MKFTVLFFLALFSLPAVLARTLDCSTSNGELHLTEWSKSGGAAPAPGMLLSTTQWIYRNNVVYSKSTYHAGDTEEKSESNISWAMNSNGQVYVENVSTGYSTHSVFATLIDMQSTDGQNMSGMEVPKLTDWFLCEADDAFYP